MMPVSGTCVMNFSYEMSAYRWPVSSVLVFVRKHGAYGNHQAPNAVIIYRPGGYSLKSHEKQLSLGMFVASSVFQLWQTFRSFPDHSYLLCRR